MTPFAKNDITIFRANARVWGDCWRITPQVSRPNKAPLEDADRPPTSFTGMFSNHPSKEPFSNGANKRGTRFVGADSSKPRLQLVRCDLGFAPRAEDVLTRDDDGTQWAIHSVNQNSHGTRWLLELTGPRI